MIGEFPELGFYSLRGHLPDPRQILTEARQAEGLGLGTLWLSERFDMKDLAVLCGAATVVTDGLGVATGVINPHTRSLPVLASMGATLQTLSGGRFTMGFGRAFPWHWDRWGLPRVTSARLEETVTLLRRLWQGERLDEETAYHGRLRGASIGFTLENPPPLFIAALGPQSQALAGRCFDGMLLHPYWSNQAVAEATDRMRKAAADAGRDPESMAVWTCLVMACDADEDRALETITRRLTTYMQLPRYGEVICAANGWDPALLNRLRSHPVLEGRVADSTTFTSDELRTLRDDVYPPDWLAAGASGSPPECARRVLEQFDHGATGVLLHGSSPSELTGFLAAYRAARP